MLITPYKNDKKNILYYRVKLNKKDIEWIKSPENLFYQLKCIGANPEIYDNANCFLTENLSFNDRLYPSIPMNEKIRKKAEFGILLSHVQKKGYLIVLKIEFYKGNYFVFRDVYILNQHGMAQEKFILSRIEYMLSIELEKIYETLFKLPKQLNLCKTCKYFYEYQANGYCIKYHPDSKIPSDF